MNNIRTIQYCIAAYPSILGQRSTTVLIIARQSYTVIAHLFIDGLLIAGISDLRRGAVSVAVLLTGPRRRVAIRGLEERTGTRGIVLTAGWRFAAGLASRQRRRVLTWGRRDRLPALYQFHDLVSFPGEIAVRPERIVPTAVRAETRRTQLLRLVQCNQRDCCNFTFNNALFALF